jgi:rhamnose utilization protein RhaD (predicted bifunctional aldolase and dehydrogenase)/NAD(P)-dependent dehydrogenase (short-subunit alcohol dehydrogenase family)
MLSRYEASEAERYRERYAASGEDLALRVYTSRLLGADAALVLHGGGNTSVKSTALDLYGDPVEVLYVKGSGWDLASIEPAGFPACRLAPLLRCVDLAELSDEDMVAELRRQLVDPKSPNPSVEALLHALLPAKFVDHTHADAVLAIVDQPRSEDLSREVFGESALFVPYVMPGFVLARRVAELWRSHRERHGAEPSAMILDKHGIFTWGASAEESYRRMIELVTTAEQALPPPAAPPPRPGAASQRRRIALALRGSLRKRSGKRWIATWLSDDQVMRFAARDDLADVACRGCITPDHVIRTKGEPLIFAAGENGAGAALEAALDGFAARYHDYVASSAAARKRSVSELDPFPRVVLVPGHGALCAGATLQDARIVADVYQHTVSVIEQANALGGYQPVTKLDLFDVEYWSLEQAKLAGTKSGGLAGSVVLITGAASGIGLATAQAFLGASAHVMLSDRDADAVTRAVEELRRRHGPRAASCTCDVTSEADCQRAVDATCDAFGGIDVLVSNAGTAPEGALHESTGARALERSLGVNLLGHQHMARFVSEALIVQGTGGALLFNASKAAFNPGPVFGPYAVPKAALLGLMRQYAIDLGKHGIRANAVNADRVRTQLFDAGVLEARARARGLTPEAYFESNLLGRETRADQVAEAFVFLAGAEATTGCVVTVDGGNPAAFPR